MQPAIYTRVSTAEQANGKCSLDVQKDECTKYCKSQGWDEPYYYSDPGWSGGNINRPGFQRMLTDIQSGIIGVVLTYKVDRLSRSMVDGLVVVQDNIISNNVRYISVQDHIDVSATNSQDVLKLQMMLMIAEAERKAIKERMAMGAIDRAKKGYWHGCGFSPIGYDYDHITHTLKVNEQEAEQVRLIFSLLVDKGMNISQIQKYMYSHGYKYSIGGSFKSEKCKGYNTSEYNHHKTIRDILNNKIYAGYVVVKVGNKSYKAQVAKAKRLGQSIDSIPRPEEICVKGVHEPIISEEMWQKSQSKLYEVSWEAVHSKPDEAIHRKSPWASKYLLTGILWCKHCGSRYHVCGSFSGKKRKYIPYYMCNRRQHPKLHGKCDNKIWRVDALDAQVVSDIIFLCKSEKRYNAQIAAQSGIISKKNPLESSEKINALNQQVDVLTRKYNRAVKMSLDVEDERLSVSYSQEAQNISEQIASARKAIEDLRKSIARAYAAPITYGEAHVLANDLENVLHSGDSQEAQRIIRKLIYRIDVDGDDLYYTLTGSAQEK